MPLEPGVTIHADAMASHFGQEIKKTKQQKRKPQTNPTASEHPGSTLPGPIFFFMVQWDAFHWGWQFVVRDSRLHPTENAVSPRVFFFGGGGRRHPTERQMRQGHGTAEP